MLRHVSVGGVMATTAPLLKHFAKGVVHPGKVRIKLNITLAGADRKVKLCTSINHPTAPDCAQIPAFVLKLPLSPHCPCVRVCVWGGALCGGSWPPGWSSATTGSPASCCPPHLPRPRVNFSAGFLHLFVNGNTNKTKGTREMDSDDSLQPESTLCLSQSHLSPHTVAIASSSQLWCCYSLSLSYATSNGNPTLGRSRRGCHRGTSAFTVVCSLTMKEGFRLTPDLQNIHFTCCYSAPCPVDAMRHCCSLCE